jgi:hypothetical protein
MRAGLVIVALVAVNTVAAKGQASPWHVDLAGTIQAEAWDLNEAREELVGVSVGLDRRVWRGLAVRAEGMFLHVSQRGNDASVRGILVGARGRWRRSFGRPFVDLAAGVSGATERVPPRGTTFNYLLASGAGVELPFGPFSFDVGIRWLHVSNNGREGRHINPDIQSLGPVLAIGWDHAF